MISRWSLRAAAVAVVLGGGSYLATSADATVLNCSDDEWNRAIARAEEACGSQASIVADCEGGRLITREIYCY
jgi:hypothetical protein